MWQLLGWLTGATMTGMRWLSVLLGLLVLLAARFDFDGDGLLDIYPLQ